MVRVRVKLLIFPFDVFFISIFYDFQRTQWILSRDEIDVYKKKTQKEKKKKYEKWDWQIYAVGWQHLILWWGADDRFILFLIVIYCQYWFRTEKWWKKYNKHQIKINWPLPYPRVKVSTLRNGFAFDSFMLLQAEKFIRWKFYLKS